MIDPTVVLTPAQTPLSLKDRLLLARAGAALFRNKLDRLRNQTQPRDLPLLKILDQRAREEEEVETRLRQLDFTIPIDRRVPFRPERAEALLNESFPTAFLRLGEGWLGREAVFHFLEALDRERARFFTGLARGAGGGQAGVLLDAERARSEWRIEYWRSLILPAA